MTPVERPGGGLIGPLLVLAGAVLWGTTGTAQALGAAGVDGGVAPSAVGAARIAVGGTGLLALALLRGTLPSPVQLRVPGITLALVAGAAAIATYQVTFFAGVARAGVALGTVVAIGSAPAFTGLVSWVARGERPESGWPLATLLAVAGSALLLLPHGGVRVDAGGIALALVAGLCFGVGTVAMKALIDAGVEPGAVVALIFAAGAVALAPVLLGSDLRWLATMPGALTALYLGLVATTLAYVLFSRGLQAVASSSAATLALAEPLTAALLGLVLLAERPGPFGWVGGTMVLAGLVVLSTRRSTRRSRHE